MTTKWELKAFCDWWEEVKRTVPTPAFVKAEVEEAIVSCASRVGAIGRPPRESYYYENGEFAVDTGETDYSGTAIYQEIGPEDWYRE